MIKKVAAALAAVVVLVLLFALPRESKVEAQKFGERPPPPVETAKVVKREIGENLSLHGNVHADKSATVRAEVQGAVISFKKIVGDRVIKGEVICRIDPSKYRIALNLAESELKRAKAGLQKTKLDEKRLYKLFTEEVVSLEQLQDAQLTFTMAEAELASREAAVNQAKRNLQLTSIRAPYKGFLAEKHLEVGDWVSEGKEVFDIVDLSSVYVYVDLPERNLGRFKLKSPAKVLLDAYPEVEFKGIVTRIAPRASENTRVFTMRVEFDDPKGLARVGLFARVEITSEKRLAIMVPKDAVVERGPMKMVFAVNDGTVKQVMVNVLRQKGDMVEVRGELNAGDEVVVTGNEILRDGAKVNVTLKRK
jgi:membrane fusion protein (multidrug efflux system)